MVETDAQGAGKPEKKGNAFPVFDPRQFARIGNRNLVVATRAARAYFNGAAKMNQEMMGFVNERVKKDMKTASSVMGSTSSEEAYHAQAEFVKEAIRDYAEEASRVLHMTADIARQALAPVEESTEELLHSIDERTGKKTKTTQ